MRIGIPVLNGRVAPRCTTSDGLLLVNLQRGRVSGCQTVPLADDNWLEFVSQVVAAGVDTIVCGGISRDGKDGLQARKITVIENVACTTDEVLEAIAAGRLRAGYGFEPDGRSGGSPEGGSLDPGPTHDGKIQALGPAQGHLDCLSCKNRVCLLGKDCMTPKGLSAVKTDQDFRSMLESAQDITFEAERTLCRLSEVIYFCLEMKFRRIGVAYCIDLDEPTRILVNVLRRFFKTYPVCCKIGGKIISDPEMVTGGRVGQEIVSPVACNPQGQAMALNAKGTDLNVLVGLCVGTDCVFAKASEAPVTTLFVKDKSLANNPIGAVYSDYYLKEAAQTPLVRT